MQQAFLDAQAFQCGFCTSGMILTCASLNQAQRQDLGAALKGNLCRCTGYRAIEGRTQRHDPYRRCRRRHRLRPQPAGPRRTAGGAGYGALQLRYGDRRLAAHQDAALAASARKNYLDRQDGGH